MIDKSEQFVGDNFSKYSRKWLEETYRVQFTDKQWDSYPSGRDPRES